MSLRVASPIPEGAEFTYVIFTNETRTEYLRAWPGIRMFQPGGVWRLERASRDEPAATWGSPRDIDPFVGDLAALKRWAEDTGYVSMEYGR